MKLIKLLLFVSFALNLWGQDCEPEILGNLLFKNERPCVTPGEIVTIGIEGDIKTCGKAFRFLQMMQIDGFPVNGFVTQYVESQQSAATIPAFQDSVKLGYCVAFGSWVTDNNGTANWIPEKMVETGEFITLYKCESEPCDTLTILDTISITDYSTLVENDSLWNANDSLQSENDSLWVELGICQDKVNELCDIIDSLKAIECDSQIVQEIIVWVDTSMSETIKDCQCNFTLSPNPVTNDEFRILWELPFFQEGRVTIRDINGTRYYQKELDPRMREYEQIIITTDARFPDGIYFVTLDIISESGEYNRLTKKLIKQ